MCVYVEQCFLLHWKFSLTSQLDTVSPLFLGIWVVYSFFLSKVFFWQKPQVSFPASERGELKASVTVYIGVYVWFCDCACVCGWMHSVCMYYPIYTESPHVSWADRMGVRSQKSVNASQKRSRGTEIQSFKPPLEVTLKRCKCICVSKTHIIFILLMSLYIYYVIWNYFSLDLPTIVMAAKMARTLSVILPFHGKKRLQQSQHIQSYRRYNKLL